MADQTMSSDLELSSSSSNSSVTTDSSSIPSSSPPFTPTAAALPQHTITVSPAISSASSRRAYRSRSEVLKSIGESIVHAKTLERLRESDKEFQKEASKHKKAVRRLSKDLYMILSVYAVMEGVVFAAVAQSTMFTCEDQWGPMGLASAVTLGTMTFVYGKLQRMADEKKQVQNFEGRASAVYDQISQLYLRGADCNIDQLEPERGIADRSETGGLGCIFSGHGVLMLGFLAILSFLILVSCNQMLCQRSCSCTASSSS